MRSPTPTIKSIYSGTTIPTSKKPKPNFVRFDNSRFIQTVAGPTNFIICCCVLLSMCLSGLVVNEIQPIRYCYHENDDTENCFKCPPFANCYTGSPVCPDPFINKLNFCVLPDSEEFYALDVVPLIRGFSDSDIRLLTPKLNVSQNILKIAIQYSKNENLGGFQTVLSYIYLIIASASWAGTVYIIWLQRRYKREHAYIVQAYKYLEKKPPTKFSINHILRHIKVDVDEATKQRILRELVKVPQFDVEIDNQTVFRRI
ncbi:hypothetical protein TRFO_02891 [Tritrichomonas foetus]|uniref:Uncharacterized protein n=1 Tax=Tritrichomonas foetus TaxID=1144522 RepID=A0A1J4L0S1_9EUKA|nr:hypothetical protein TRFO_02891 [Tritrichomonas foetus]|eukprot:OHT15548.1 hypothetical protein TRFO_02891 [Tritrichomonas foetus]